MNIELTTDGLTAVPADLLAVGIRAGDPAKDATVRELDRALGGALSKLLADEDFKGKLGESVVMHTTGRIKAGRVLVYGLGKDKPGANEARALATRAAAVGRSLATVAVLAPSVTPEAVQSAAEGLTLGGYRFTRYLTGERKPKRQTSKGLVVVHGKPKGDLKRSLERGRAVADAMNLVRDLVNSPPNDLHPVALADAAKKAAGEAGVTCKIWDKKEIQKQNMHLLLAVNRGSGIEPRFVHLSYVPKGAKKGLRKVVFVGKGLTFDSGGLCIKPAKSMIDMKCDMAGAAVTIAVVVAAAKLKLPIEVHGLIASTENMPGPDAYRPGDVFPSLDGKSVEIINTDAEGRLVLADALAFARKLEPDYVIDHATLTGACMVALGPWTAGLFANDDGLAKRYLAASTAAGEQVWRMPLVEDLRETLKSDVADLKHTGEQYGGAITAALFLREFVGDSKWAHMDIAGPAFLERSHGIYPKGGTGFGVLTALHFLEALAR